MQKNIDPIELRAKELFELEGRDDVTWDAVALKRILGRDVIPSLGEGERDRFRAIARAEKAKSTT